MTEPIQIDGKQYEIVQVSGDNYMTVLPKGVKLAWLKPLPKQPEEEAIQICEDYCEKNGQPMESGAVHYYDGECEAEFANEVKS